MPRKNPKQWYQEHRKEEIQRVMNQRKNNPEKYKEYMKIYNKEYYAKNRKKMLEYSKKWAKEHGFIHQKKWKKTPAGKESARRYRQTHDELIKAYIVENREKYNNCKTIWKKNNKEKLKAHAIAERHIKTTQCSNCGSKENLHRHHSDYNKPLEVVILCAGCHSRLHHQEEV